MTHHPRGPRLAAEFLAVHLMKHDSQGGITWPCWCCQLSLDLTAEIRNKASMQACSVAKGGRSWRHHNEKRPRYSSFPSLNNSHCFHYHAILLLRKHYHHWISYHKHCMNIIFPLDYNSYKYLVESCSQQLRRPLMLFGDDAMRGSTQQGKMSAGVNCTHVIKQSLRTPNYSANVTNKFL
jgi:hypothetical protein